MFRFIILSLVIITIDAQQWISPCPDLFQYDKAGVQGDTWFGDITLKTDQELSGIWLRIVLDRPPIEVDTDFGEVVQREAQDYLIRKPTQKLSVGDTQRIRIQVKFNTLEPAPQLVGFRLNARVVCPENGILDKNQPITPPPQTKPTNEIPSPCPNEFKYEPLNHTDKWFGNVILKSETQLDGVWIRISLDRETVQLGNWFGEVTTGDNKEYVIKNPKFTLLPGNTHTVRFFIKFKPGTPLPKVVEIKLNGNVICQADVLVVPVNSNSPILPNGGISPSVQRPQRPPPQAIAEDDYFRPDFLQGSNKPILDIDNNKGGNRFPQIQTINIPNNQNNQQLPDLNSDEFLSDDKILVFPNYYYVIQKFPKFTLIHIKRRTRGQTIGIGNYQLPFLI